MRRFSIVLLLFVASVAGHTQGATILFPQQVDQNGSGLHFPTITFCSLPTTINTLGVCQTPITVFKDQALTQPYTSAILGDGLGFLPPNANTATSLWFTPGNNYCFTVTTTNMQSPSTNPCTPFSVSVAPGTSPSFAGLTVTGSSTLSGDVLLSTGKVLKWNADTGLSRDSAGVIDVGNGTQGDKSGRANLTTLGLYTGGLTPATIVNDGAGGINLSTNSGKTWEVANSGVLNSPLGGNIQMQGATSGQIQITVPAVAGSNTLTMPAATDTLVGRATTDTLTNKTLTSPSISNPTITGNTLVNRIKANQGTALVSGDFSLSGGWGTTATVTPSGTDAALGASITANGTGQSANPTVTLTFHDGTWTTSPICVIGRGDASGSTGGNGIFSATGITATQLTVTFISTPTAGSNYQFYAICNGRP